MPSPSKVVIKKREIKSPGNIGIDKRLKASEEKQTHMLLPIVRVAPVQLKPFSLTENVAPLTFSLSTGLQPPTLLEEENLKQPLNVIIFTDITKHVSLLTTLNKHFIVKVMEIEVETYAVDFSFVIFVFNLLKYVKSIDLYM